MQETELQVNIEEVEPTPEELELQAAKQLLIELQMVKRRINESKSLMNGMLIMQVKFLLNGLINKYNNVGLLTGESVTLKLSSKKANATIIFVLSPRLESLFNQVVEAETKRLAEENKKQEFTSEEAK